MLADFVTMASGVILALDSRRQTTANGGGVSGRLAVAGELSDSSPWLKYHLDQLPDRVYQDAAYRKVHYLKSIIYLFFSRTLGTATD